MGKENLKKELYTKLVSFEDFILCTYMLDLGALLDRSTQSTCLCNFHILYRVGYLVLGVVLKIMNFLVCFKKYLFILYISFFHSVLYLQV